MWSNLESSLALTAFRKELFSLYKIQNTVAGFQDTKSLLGCEAVMFKLGAEVELIESC
jgi:hypothetical protein